MSFNFLKQSCFILFIMLLISLFPDTNNAFSIDTKKEESELSTKNEIDSIAQRENENEIRKYLEPYIFHYIHKVLDYYPTIDEAINQDSLNILDEVLSQNPSKKKNKRGYYPSGSDLQEMLLRYFEEINYLINRGADICRVNYNLETAFSRFLNTPFSVNYGEEMLKTINLFIENGADINAVDTNGNTCFQKILKTKNIDLVKSVINGVSDINHKNDEGTSLLMSAIIIKDSSIIDELLNFGASVNDTNNAGKTVLLSAIDDINNFEIIKKIIDKTQDLNITYKNKSALDYALTTHISRFKDGKDLIPNKNLILYLSEMGAKVTDPDNEGILSSFLFNYMGYNTQDLNEILAAIIKSGARINNNWKRWNPLLVCLKHNISRTEIETIKLLVEAGADVNATYKEQTAIDLLDTTNVKSPKIAEKMNLFREYLISKGAKSFDEIPG